MNRVGTLIKTPRFLLSLVALAAAFVFVQNQTPRTHFNIKNVTVAEAKALVDGGAIVVDVREQEQFNARHIPGSILIPLEVLRVGIPASIANAKQKQIVVYCGDGLTHGPEGTELLNKSGFANAVNIQAGIEGWAAAGLPIQR